MDQMVDLSGSMQAILEHGLLQVAVQPQAAITTGPIIQTTHPHQQSITVTIILAADNHVFPTELVHRLFGRTLIHSHTAMNSK